MTAPVGSLSIGSPRTGPRRTARQTARSSGLRSTAPPPGTSGIPQAGDRPSPSAMQQSYSPRSRPATPTPWSPGTATTRRSGMVESEVARLPHSIVTAGVSDARGRSGSQQRSTIPGSRCDGQGRGRLTSATPGTVHRHGISAPWVSPTRTVLAGRVGGGVPSSMIWTPTPLCCRSSPS
jgi:hypothetical protein